MAQPQSLSEISPYLSFSSAELFRRCSKSWQSQYVDGTGRGVTTQASLLGTLVHKILELACRQPRGDSDPDIYWSRLKRDAWAGLASSSENKTRAGRVRRSRSYLKDAEAHISTWLRLEGEEALVGARPEVEVFGYLNNVPTRGIIDRTNVDTENRVVISDYKSGRLPDEIGAQHEEQLLLYAALVEQTGYTVDKVRIVYTRGAGLVHERQVTPADLEGVAERHAKTFEEIEFALMFDAFEATPGDHCRWCALRDTCPVSTA